MRRAGFSRVVYPDAILIDSRVAAGATREDIGLRYLFLTHVFL